MKGNVVGLGLLAVFLVLAALLPTSSAEETAPRISQEQLLSTLDTPSLTILDARLVKDWRKSDSKIKRAVRVDPHDVSSWIGTYSPDQKIVIYCA